MLKSEKINTNLILVISIVVVYTLANFTKSNYTASVAYIVSKKIFSKTNAGLIASLFYLFYGVGQILGGFIVDKYSPYKMIMVGLVGALISNLILVFTNNYIVVLIVWSLCGLIQFGIWPGVCKIMISDLTGAYKEKATIYMQYAVPGGYCLSYVFAALVLENFGWVGMFLSSVITLLGLIILWIFVCKIRPRSEEKVDNLQTEKPLTVSQTIKKANKNSFFKTLIVSGFIFTILTSLFDSLLVNGAQVWIPTMIMESYEGVSSQLSSFFTIILNVAQILGILFIANLSNKIRNPIIGSIVHYAVAAIALIPLIFIGKISVVLAIAMFILVFVGIQTKRGHFFKMTYVFGKYGYGATFSGLTNALSAFGIVVASLVYGPLSEMVDWWCVSLIWLVIGILAILVCIPSLIKWKKFSEGSN